MDVLKESRVVPDAVQMLDSTVILDHHQAAGARGDSATGFWPIERWVHNQDTPPCQRRRLAHGDRDHARSGSNYAGYNLMMADNPPKLFALRANRGCDYDKIRDDIESQIYKSRKVRKIVDMVSIPCSTWSSAASIS